MKLRHFPFRTLKRHSSTTPPPEVTDTIATSSSTLMDGAVTFLTNVTLDTKIGAGLTFLGFYIADRLDKINKMRSLVDNQGQTIAQMNEIADEARLLRLRMTSFLDLGPSRIQAIQDQQQEAEQLLRNLGRITRQAHNLTPLPYMYYGLGMWNSRRLIVREGDMNETRLTARISLNEMIVHNKTAPLTPETLDARIKAIRLEPETNPQFFSRAIDRVQGYFSDDIAKIRHSLERDVLDTRLTILTDNNYFDEALRIVKNDILAPAKKNAAALATLNAPTLNRVASVFLRAGANAHPFDTSIPPLLESLYGTTPGTPDWLKQMRGEWETDRNKWYIAATMICQRSIDATLTDKKWQSGVPYSFLGTVCLRKAYALSRQSEAHESNPPADLEAKRKALLEQALTFFDQALARDQRAVYYLANRSLCLLMLGDVHQASDSIGRALAEDPHNAYSHMVKSSILLEQGKTAEAVAEASFIRYVPGNNHTIKTIVHTIAAQVHAAAGNKGKMHHHILHAREDDPLLKGSFPIGNPVLDRLENEVTNAPSTVSFVQRLVGQLMGGRTGR